MWKRRKKTNRIHVEMSLGVFRSAHPAPQYFEDRHSKWPPVHVKGVACPSIYKWLEDLWSWEDKHRWKSLLRQKNEPSGGMCSESTRVPSPTNVIFLKCPIWSSDNVLGFLPQQTQYLISVAEYFVIVNYTNASSVMMSAMFSELCGHPSWRLYSAVYCVTGTKIWESFFIHFYVKDHSIDPSPNYVNFNWYLSLVPVTFICTKLLTIHDVTV